MLQKTFETFFRFFVDFNLKVIMKYFYENMDYALCDNKD